MEQRNLSESTKRTLIQATVQFVLSLINKLLYRKVKGEDLNENSQQPKQ